MSLALKSVGLTLLLFCSTTIALCAPTIWRSPVLAQSTTTQDRKAEGDRLLKLGLQGIKDIEKLRKISLSVLIDVDKGQSFKDVEARRSYIRTQQESILTRIKRVRAEIVKTWLQALKIYRDPNFRIAFPLESRQGEQKIVAELIEIDFDDRQASEEENQIFQPQEIRELVQQALESQRDRSFRAAFPLESHQGEQSIVIKLMDSSPNRFPSKIVNEKIFRSQEALALVRQALKSYRDPSFRAAFPLESRQGEQNILTALSPFTTEEQLKHHLIQLPEKLQLWQQIREGYRDPSFRAAFPLESRQGEGSALARLGYIYLFEIGQPEQALTFYKQGLSAAYEAGDRLLAIDILGWTISAYWTLGKYQQVIEAYEQASTLFQETYTRIKDGSDPIINKKLSKLDLKDKPLLLKQLQQLENEFTYGIGTAYLALGKPQQAINFYRQSLVIPKEQLLLYQKTRMLSGLGIAYWLTGQYEQATEIYAQLRDTVTKERRYEQLEVIFITEVTLNELGYFPLIMMGRGYDHLGRYQQTIELYRQTLVNARKDSSSSR